jgi:hypothetical protein
LILQLAAQAVHKLMPCVLDGKWTAVRASLER